MISERNVLYLAAVIVALATVLAVVPSNSIAFAQHSPHCSLPNGNAFPGQGGANSNPQSNGGGCPNGLTDEFGNGNN